MPLTQNTQMFFDRSPRVKQARPVKSFKGGPPSKIQHRHRFTEQSERADLPASPGAHGGRGCELEKIKMKI
jgi:hypothetical protein